MTMMNPNIGAMHAASLPPVWRTPPGQSMSPAQYAQSQGRNWSQAVNDRNFMQGYYGNMQSGPDYSGGRYVPPTFAYGYGNNGQIDPSRMVWNEQRNYYTPEQNYRFPTMPNFGMMEGIGNYGMNPFQQMMQMQQMGWLMGGRGNPWGGGGMDYSGGAAELFRRGGGGEQNPYGYDPEAAAQDPEGFARWMQEAQAQGINPQAMGQAGQRAGGIASGLGNRFGGYRPRMPMFGGGMFSPYFGYGGLGGWFGQGQQVPGLGGNQAGLKPATVSQSGPPAPGGG